MGVASPVLEILLLSKTVNFPFRPWSSKKLIDRNWLKKFMQVGVDVTCMYIDFGGCSFSSFRDTATLKNGKFPFPTMDYIIRKFNRSELAKKIHASRD